MDFLPEVVTQQSDWKKKHSIISLQISLRRGDVGREIPYYPRKRFDRPARALRCGERDILTIRRNGFSPNRPGEWTQCISCHQDARSQLWFGSPAGGGAIIHSARCEEVIFIICSIVEVLASEFLLLSFFKKKIASSQSEAGKLSIWWFIILSYRFPVWNRYGQVDVF